MRSIFAALIVTIVGLVSTADAQPGWTGDVRTISTTVFPRSFGSAATAVDPTGNAYAIWTVRDDVTPSATTRIEIARYIAATDSWSDPITLAGPGQVGFSQAAVDTSGNAFFVVPQYLGGRLQIDVIRHESVSATTTTTTLAQNAIAPGGVKVDAAGNAMVVWSEGAGIFAARYDVALATWGAPVKISDAGAFSGALLAVDGLNDITAIWIRDLPGPSLVVQAARFASSTGAWSPVVDLLTPVPSADPDDPSLYAPRIVADSAGNVTAVWVRSFSGSDDRIQAARFVKTVGTWSGVIDLSVPGTFNDAPDVAVDPVGNVITTWYQYRSGVIQATRFDADTASWSSVRNLSCAGGFAVAYSQAVLKMDAGGNALVLWTCDRGGADRRVTASRYTAASSLWSTPTELSAAGQSGVNPDIGFDAAGNAVAVWVQGAGFLGAIQATRWVAQPPAAPTDLVVASVTGHTVTLAWKKGAGSTPTGYVLEGGLTPGSVQGSLRTESPAMTFSFTAPSGVFFVRVRALLSNFRSAASNEIQLIVNAPLSPSPPANVLGMVNGSTVALSWTNTFNGGAPTALVLNVTGAQTGSFPLGVSDAVSFNGVPDGTYTLTLTASNATGVSPPSNPVTLTIPGSCSGPPSVPMYFAVAKSGSALTLTWHPPVAGRAVTHYIVHASGALTGSVSTVTRSLTGTVGPGIYSLSVVAANECGTSAPSDVITVTVP